MKSECILFFVKYPEPGKVKTRLAKSIGDIQAAKLYKSFVLDVLSVLKRTMKEFIVFYDPKSYGGKIKRLLGSENVFFSQSGKDLGVRMHSAFKKAFGQGYRKAVLIGSDSPGIGKDTFKNAFKALDKKDMVIGPADDGGYYLVGFNRNSLCKSIFSDVKWSSNKVFGQTLKAIKRSKLSFKTISQETDIDTLTDLNIFLAKKGNKKLAQNTFRSAKEVLCSKS